MVMYIMRGMTLNYLSNRTCTHFLLYKFMLKHERETSVLYYRKYEFQGIMVKVYLKNL